MAFSEMHSRTLTVFLFSTILGAMPSGLTAAPKISDAYLDDSGDVIITGSKFGNGPTVAIHDDFSNAEVGDDTVSLSPKVGKWLISNSNSNQIVIDEKHGSKSLFVRGNGSSRFVFGIPDESGPQGLRTFQEVYLSYTIKDLGEFPGANGTSSDFSNQSATKDAWMMLGDRGDNTEYAVSKGDASGHDLYIPGWTGGGFNIAGNNTRMNPSFWQGGLTENWVFGGWHTKMFHAELDPADPYGAAQGFFAFLNRDAYQVNVRNGNFMEDQRSEGVPYPFWDRIKFFAWMNTGDADVKRVVDEIYVAIGDNANARVLVTDNQSLNRSTRVFHLSPQSWTDSEIVARFPDYLPDSNSYFLHVIDASNDNSASFGLCQSCPNPPQVFQVE
jgi:hypothetical protein|tara:strand:- start:1954 stop:3111 length:1158 start_codon:yes stop_codon:yes gene_type:complete